MADPIGDALRTVTIASWHLDEDSGTRIDATENGYDLPESFPEFYGHVIGVAGKIGQCVRIMDDPSNIAQLNLLLATLVPSRVIPIDAGLTVTAWAKCNTWQSSDVVDGQDRPQWPLRDACAAGIVAQDVFEHLIDVIGAMNECRRVLVAGGRLTVRGPVPESENLWVDVSHRRAFVEHSFDHFDWNTDFGRKYRYGSGPWHVLSASRDGSNIIFDLERL